MTRVHFEELAKKGTPFVCQYCILKTNKVVIQQLQAEVADLKSELTEVAALKLELAEASAEVSALKSELAMLTDSVAPLKFEITQLKESLVSAAQTAMAEKSTRGYATATKSSTSRGRDDRNPKRSARAISSTSASQVLIPNQS